MDSMNRLDMDDAFLDAAATEAVGAHTVEESDAFVQTLAKANERERRTARQLRGTVARMAAASPYMEPPESLRGKILAATADKTFKMEDYRRSADTSPRMMRWGLVAAVLFLSASTWYNARLQNVVKQQQLALNQQQVALNQQHQQEVAMVDQIHRQGTALTTVLDPNMETLSLTNDEQQIVGKVLFNSKTQAAVAILPQELASQFADKQFVLDRDGEKKVFATQIIATAQTGIKVNPNVKDHPLEIRNPQIDRHPSLTARMGQ